MVVMDGLLLFVDAMPFLCTQPNHAATLHTAHCIHKIISHTVNYVSVVVVSVVVGLYRLECPFLSSGDTLGVSVYSRHGNQPFYIKVNHVTE